MLHTYYSNAYEVLRAVLGAHLQEDARERRETSGALPALFAKDRVLIPSVAVREDLQRSFADAFGICAGIDFLQTSDYFEGLHWYPTARHMSGHVLDWVVWRWLNREDFTSQHPRLARFLEKKNGAERFQLALRISRLFTKYASYRLDWLLRWSDEVWSGEAHADLLTPEAGFETMAAREEAAALSHHPDFLWQKALWQAIVTEARTAEASDAGTGAWRRALQFQYIEKVLADIPAGDNLHVFLPFTVPPLMLPFLKVTASRGTVRLYLMQPSNGFWFDAAAEGGTPALDYLRRNAASTRATVDRLWRFAADVPVPTAAEEGGPEEGPDTKGPVIAWTVEGDASASSRPRYRDFSFRRDRLQDLRLDREAETESLYLQFAPRSGETLLTRAQDALLSFDDEEAGGRRPMTPDDRSVRFVEAPTTVREAESLVDYLTALFAEDPTLRPCDVLVTTPDIATFAPVLEGVLTALPPERRLPFRMVGKPLTMENLAASAFLQLLDLVSGLTTLSALEDWLELPLVGESLGLDYADLSILRDWLNDAGFREGLSDEHLAVFGDPLGTTAGGFYGTDEIEGARDGTLSRALERLSAGFLLDRSPLVDWADTAPVRRSRAHYETTADRPALFTTLLTLYDRLEAARRDWQAVSDHASNAQGWEAFAERLADDFFGRPDVRETREELKLVVKRLRIDMEEGLGADATVEYRAYRAALEQSFQEPRSGAVPRDAITVTDMTGFRGLPFRVVACLGLSEASSFPGQTSFEEFDLMALTVRNERGEERSLRRAGDRDSREDNRNVFTDLFRSARSHFYVSWTIGFDAAQPALPSVVVEELERFLLTLLPEDLPSGALRVRLPLTAVAQENLMEEGLRFWTSRDPALREAVTDARQTGYRATPPAFAGNTSLAAPRDGVVTLDEFLRFWGHPAGWVNDRVGVETVDLEAAATLSVVPTNRVLEKSRRKRSLRALFLEGATSDRVARLVSEDPVNGDPGLRGWWLDDEVAEAAERQELWRALHAGRAAVRRAVTVEGWPASAARVIRRLTGELTLYTEAGAKTEVKERGEAETLALIEFCDSRRLWTTAVLRYLAVNAAGVPTRLYTIGEDKDDPVRGYDPPAPEEALAVLSPFVALMAVSYEYPVTVPEAFDGSVLWRGQDRESADRAAGDLSEALKQWIGTCRNPAVTAESVLLRKDQDEVRASEVSEVSKSASSDADKKPKRKSTAKKTAKKALTPEEERLSAHDALREAVERLAALSRSAREMAMDAERLRVGTAFAARAEMKREDAAGGAHHG